MIEEIDLTIFIDVANVSVYRDVENNTYIIHSLFVPEPQRRQGIAKQLLRRAIIMALRNQHNNPQYKEYPICIQARSDGSVPQLDLIKFYRSYGFKIIYSCYEYTDLKYIGNTFIVTPDMFEYTYTN